jgi:hypothetical protein
MTVLWWHHLTAHDRVSVTPHGLAGTSCAQLPARRAGRVLPEHLPAFGGLQSYPSRSQDPTWWTTPPDQWVPAPRRPSGVQSPAVMWLAPSVRPGMGTSSHCSATPNSTRARSRRRSRTRWSPVSAKSCASSIPLGSPWTGRSRHRRGPAAAHVRRRRLAGVTSRRRADVLFTIGSATAPSTTLNRPHGLTKPKGAPRSRLHSAALSDQGRVPFRAAGCAVLRRHECGDAGWSSPRV